MSRWLRRRVRVVSLLGERQQRCAVPEQRELLGLWRCTPSGITPLRVSRSASKRVEARRQPRYARAPPRREAFVRREYAVASDRWPRCRARSKLHGMNARARKIIDEALALPEEDRALVVAELQESLEPGSAEEVQAAWDDELVRRAQMIASGKADLVDGEQVAQRIRAKYSR